MHRPRQVEHLADAAAVERLGTVCDPGHGRMYEALRNETRVENPGRSNRLFHFSESFGSLPFEQSHLGVGQVLDSVLVYFAWDAGHVTEFRCQLVAFQRESSMELQPLWRRITLPILAI